MSQLDPNIILQAGRAQGINPAQLMEQRAQIQLRNLALQKQERDDRRQIAEDERLTGERQTLKDVGAAFASGDGAGARQKAAASGNFDLVKQLDSMDDAKRKRAFEISQSTAPLLLSLKTVDPAARVEALGQLAPQLVERGFTPQQIEQLAQDGVSDETLDHIGSSALTISEYMTQKNKDRDFGLETDKFKYQQGNDEANRGVTIRGQDVSASTARRGQDLSHADSAAGRAVTMRGQDMTDRRAAAGGGREKPNATVVGKYIGNNQSIRNIDRAWTALSSAPKSVGASGYTPDFILKRTDPKGVEARAAIANIGSLLIHDRSGAAVTIAETPRLVPFIPQVTDDEKTAKKKLKQLRAALTETQDDFDSVYGGLPKYKAPASAPAKAVKKEVATDVDAILKKHGVIK
jgi:hypothetical protein